MPEQNNFLTENKYPTLYVKDFGKIKEAEIELALFTVFVGDNNSGKSYLLNLIWGLQKEVCEDTGLFSISNNIYIEKEQAYIDIVNKLDSIIDLPNIKEEKNKELDLNETDINNIMILINIILHENKNELIKSLFNSDDVSVDKVSLFIPKDSDLYKLSFTYSVIKDSSSYADTKQCKNSQKMFRLMHDDTSDIFPFSDNEEILKNIIQILVSYVLFAFFPFNIPRIKGLIFPVFLPTSRTGFLLTYRELAKNAISNTYQIQPVVSSTIFLHSTVSFINMLHSFDFKNGSVRVKEIIDYIEKEVIHGKLEMHPETKEFLYTPEGTEIQLKMHTTSAVVTELAPLILCLKYRFLAGVLFMEEPEISLHPELQQKITRVLIKLINSCKQQVFIATHSDTITQHINNMIKLANNPPEKQTELLKEFGYDKNDIMDRDKVRMYQFDEDSKTQKTLVKPLVSSKYGFRTPTFGDFLDNMSDQIDELLEKL